MQLSSDVPIFNRSRRERKNSDRGATETYARWPSYFALVLLSCAIANAQRPLPLENGWASYGNWIVASSELKSNASSPTEVQQEEAADKPGSVIGTVLDQTRSVATGVLVHMTSEDKPFSQTLVTGDNGQFSFSNVPPGPFKVSVDAEGFGNQEFSGQLAPGQTYIVPPIVISIATVVTNVKV